MKLLYLLPPNAKSQINEAYSCQRCNKRRIKADFCLGFLPISRHDPHA